jgi:ABC-type Fe3+/spermidine/putrescine transport system ATPase subunit
MSDRIGVMNEGKLLQVGKSEDIYENPNSRFVADFIGDINLIPVSVNGQNRIKLSGGQEFPASTDDVASGTATLALRPERLSLYDLDEPIPDGLNRLQVRVARRVYYGDVYYYGVEAGTGELIEVKEENRPSVERYEIDEEAYLVWHPDAARLVVD